MELQRPEATSSKVDLNDTYRSFLEFLHEAVKKVLPLELGKPGFKSHLSHICYVTLSSPVLLWFSLFSSMKWGDSSCLEHSFKKCLKMIKTGPAVRGIHLVSK